ncbi:hypothetical protein [Paenibacillus auburnensis]|nr:hypothetical protein [Paenibacillus auburnensis]
MIDKIFGEPQLPQSIENCLLISKTGKMVHIGTVYLFSVSRKLSVREVGELWKRDSLVVNQNFVGYFSCPVDKELLQLGDDTYTIQSNPNGNNTILRFNDVSFSRTNEYFGENSSISAKFSCLTIERIVLKGNY